MADRTNKNLFWVKRKLDLAGLTDVLPEEIVDAMNQVELDIAEKCGVLKSINPITFEPGAHPDGVYDSPAGVNRILRIEQPTSWSSKIILTNDVDRFVTYKELNSTASSDHPLIVLAWAGKLRFWPVPQEGSVTLYSLDSPTTDQTEGTGDPTVSKSWDRVLRYGALADLLGGDWEKKYKDAFNEEMHSHIQESGAPLLVDHSSRRLGF